MSNLVDKYYRSTTVAEAKELKRGQLVWAPGYYVPANNTIVNLVHYEPMDERKNIYKILKSPSSGAFNHPPVHELHLEHNEEMLAVKAKLRKFIVMAQAIRPSSSTISRLHEKGALCVPLHSFQESDSPEFRTRIKALEYTWWIYVPEEKRMNINEGFVRLDRTQIVSEKLMEPIQVALTDDALFLISEWLRYYLTGNIDDIFKDDRQCLMAEMPI